MQLLLSPACRAVAPAVCLRVGLAATAWFGGILSSHAKVKGDTLVVSHVYNGYAREAAAGGGYRPETYAFAEGGLIDGQMAAGDDVSTMGFGPVAATVAGALKSQGYLASADPEKTKLMIMLWYGTTRDTSYRIGGAPIADKAGLRSRAARLLGFQKEYSRAGTLSFTDLGENFANELYGDRFFVVLKAYDFQVARKEKRLKLLWESRYSIRRQAVTFSAELPVMSGFAARTFGHETNGIFDPSSIEGRVNLGELEVLGEAKP
ncbi:MAG TPA: hypothetical protein VG936_03555 [Lacunisphaera sp.]|nr:hypothetical protein [Lacunisphaera sp.]